MPSRRMMAPPDPDLRSDDPNSFASIRARLHNQNDTIQRHEGKLTEHSIRIHGLERSVETLTTQMATREQLSSATLALATKIESSVAMIQLQLTALANDVSPIKKGIYWVVGIVLAAVVGAILSQVIRRPLV